MAFGRKGRSVTVGRRRSVLRIRAARKAASFEKRPSVPIGTKSVVEAAPSYPKPKK